MAIFRKIEKVFVGINVFVMSISLAAMIVIGFAQIILRNVFDSGFGWADIVVRALVLWVGFSGAVLATSKGRHIAIGALVKFVPHKAKQFAHFVVSVFSAVVSFFLAKASVAFVLFEMESGSFLTGKIPLWVSELIIPATFFVFTFQFLLHAFDKVEEEEIK